jgi:glycosyltransferase involved in cell wall biosynthesis
MHPTQTDHRYRVAIFARNEAGRIDKAIRSVVDDVPAGADLRIVVLINGCTDDTPAVVAECARRHPGVIDAVELPVGDKCNAWNAYVHRYADDAPVHFLMDGDVWVAPGSLPRMHAALLADPQAAAIGGVPLAGRNRRHLLDLMLERKWIYGNLYAMRGRTIAGFREFGLRLPLGLMGNDGAITHALKAPLPEHRTLDEDRIIHDRDAGYRFHSLQPFIPGDVKVYLKRRVTYWLRELQFLQIGRLRLDRMPATMDEVNRNILDSLRRARRPLDIAVRHRLARQYGRDGSRPFYGEKLPLAA